VRGILDLGHFAEAAEGDKQSKGPATNKYASNFKTQDNLEVSYTSKVNSRRNGKRTIQWAAKQSTRPDYSLPLHLL
jgi:hypothetical protein